MTLKIFGAGMAGLIAAHVLKSRSPVIHEAQGELPNNHAALLRFRSDWVAKATGIDFKKVHVRKAIWDGKRLRTSANLSHNNEYSLKVTGRASGRSILNLEPVERFIAPSDFISRAAKGLDIRYGERLEGYAGQGDGSVPILSTIPMPALAGVLGVTIPIKFEARPIWSKVITIETPDIDLYQSVYFPEADNPLYRASITGKLLTLEYNADPDKLTSQGFRFCGSNVHALLGDVFGIRGTVVKVEGTKQQKFGKLLSIDDEIRRSFILYATDKHKIYSIGRFATWRQILLDDVVHDAHMIDRMIGQTDRYGLIKEQAKKG